MLKSMTGFGYSQVKTENYSINVEVKAVNHRFLDINVKIYRQYAQFEERLREMIKQKCSRGRIDINVVIKKAENLVPEVRVNKLLALSYYEALQELGAKLDLSSQIRASDFIRMPEVFALEEPEEDLESLWELLSACMQEALNEMLLMREKEGANLEIDIRNRNETIKKLTAQLEHKAPQVVKNYYEKLKTRLEELLPQQAIDPQRIIQEVAIFADKTNITEEIVRLSSHTQQLEELLSSNEPVGRQCDFLLQEMFREINTIASKSNDVEMSKTVVETKAELEKIREQIQNIE